MSQLLLQGAERRLSLWALLESQLRNSSAFLLPLRIFIGLGWLRAGVEKLGDPGWTAGYTLPTFFQAQLDTNAVYFPIYESLILQFFEPNSFVLSWVILIGELLAGVAILTGTVTNLALLAGLFMNLNFVLVGVVNPSAFYIVIQAALLVSNVGATLGGDSFLSRYVRSFYLVAQPHFELEQRPIGQWVILAVAIGCCIAATLTVPYIRDFGPHSIEDPAMLLFIMLMLGAMLGGILFVRLSVAQRSLPLPLAAWRQEQSTMLANYIAPSAKMYRRFVYPGLLVILYGAWFSYMALSDSWHLFTTLWPVSLTMTLGSFVAGATAEGGAAIAFPVFTKVLHIASTDARTFGLMIQAVGMTMAGIVILLKGVKVLPKVILWATLGGALGQVVGAYWLYLPNPYPKILFTFTAAVFGFAIIISRWGLTWEPRSTLHRWTSNERIIFFTIGVCGGAFAAITGSGIDMLTFIVLTLAFGINEKVSTPTTVIIMALNSIVGFGLHGLVLQDIGVAWDYWLVAVPIVVIGAPLGAVAASYVKRDHIILLLVSLISLELVTTILLVPFSPTALWVTAIAVVICSVGFGAMLIYRQRVVGKLTAGDSVSMATDDSLNTWQDFRPTEGHVAANSMARVCCMNCYQTQDAVNGDCIWCGASLAYAEAIPEPVAGNGGPRVAEQVIEGEYSESRDVQHYGQDIAQTPLSAHDYDNRGGVGGDE